MFWRQFPIQWKSVALFSDSFADLWKKICSVLSMENFIRILNVR